MTAMAVMLFGSLTAFASENQATTETVTIETVSYDANKERELVDVVYFQSENGNTAFSDEPFEDFETYIGDTRLTNAQ